MSASVKAQTAAAGAGNCSCSDPLASGSKESTSSRPHVAAASFDPTCITVEWARHLTETVLDASRDQPAALATYLSPDTVSALLCDLACLLRHEPTLVELHPAPRTLVTVVGDLHGQVHDLIALIASAGEPREDHWYIFNGDYVDRGAWGIELLVLLAAWKLALPRCITLLRGDHEAVGPTTFYGFKAEVLAKYGHAAGKQVYRAFKAVCRQLPLGCLLARRTLVVHGGLWRDPTHPANRGGDTAGRRLHVGNLSHLRSAAKGGTDPNGHGTSALAADVLWSDPSSASGMRPNRLRGLGTMFGPDVTERFMRENGLALVVRSHESPDARNARLAAGRLHLPRLVDGYALCHINECGVLMTLFSAPAYPMFTDHTNAAAVLMLRAPHWSQPEALVYDAAPRPTALTAMFGLDDPQDQMDSDGSEDGYGTQGGRQPLGPDQAHHQPAAPSAGFMSYYAGLNGSCSQHRASCGTGDMRLPAYSPRADDGHADNGSRRHAKDERKGMPVAGSAAAHQQPSPGCALM